jgi:hypothetical protein
MAPPSPPSELVVSTTADIVNGDVSSPAALVASPGPDGISLREAILATNNAPGTSRITFMSALAGQTVVLERFLPALAREGVSLIGLLGPDGQPSVTIDGSGARQICCPGLLAAGASNVSIQRLRLVHSVVNFINVHADEPGSPKVIRNVRIEQNVFDNTGEADGTGLSIGMEFPGTPARTAPASYAGAVSAVVSGVVVSGNTFRHFQGPNADAINVQNVGTNSLVENLTIQGNLFSAVNGPGAPAIELDNSMTNSTITGTRIVGNTFAGNWAPIHLNGGIGGNPNPMVTPATNDLISNTVISGNVFRANQWGISFTAGVGRVTGNAIVNTEISNNLMTGSQGAIDITAGADGATGNRVQGVRIVSNTIALNTNAIRVQPDRDGGHDNRIDGVVIRGSIFWGNPPMDFFGSQQITVSQVSDSVTVAPGFAGQNGNIASDPMFVDARGGDFRLKPGSPAAGKGYTPR